MPALLGPWAHHSSDYALEHDWAGVREEGLKEKKVCYPLGPPGRLALLCVKY